MVIEIKDQLDEAHFGSCTTFTCKQIAFDFGVRVITIFFKKNLDTIWELIFFDGKNDKPIVSLIIAHTIIVLDAWRMLHNSDRNYMIIFSRLFKCVCFCSSAIIWFSVENNERKTHNQIILLSLDDEIFFMMSMRVPSRTWCMRA